MLNSQQISAIKFYEGDVIGEDPFYGDEKAYVTLNSLFYPGIETEIRRSKEGKRLNAEIIRDTERLEKLLKELLSSFSCADLSAARHCFRVERYADYQTMKERKQSVSFTSTSTAGFLKYYTDRVGIALMEFIIPEKVRCLPFQEILKEDYSKDQEQEILLPPGLLLDIQEVEMNDQDLLIRDANGQPPIVKCYARVSEKKKETHQKNIYVEFKDGNQAGMRVYQDLNSGLEPRDQDVKQYVSWKESFVQNILNEY